MSEDKAETFAEQLHHMVAGYFLSVMMDKDADHKDRDFARFYLFNYRRMFPLTGQYYMPDGFLERYDEEI